MVKSKSQIAHFNNKPTRATKHKTPRKTAEPRHCGNGTRYHWWFLVEPETQIHNPLWKPEKIHNISNCSVKMKRAGKGEATADVDITGNGGIIKTIIKEGTGETIPAGMNAKVHYTGKLLNGTEFDSSRHRGKPFNFTVGKREVILGWDKGVATMKKGEICTLTCSPDYAYGSSGIGPIPPNSTLIFEVELLDWDDSPPGTANYFAVLVFGVIFIILYSVFNRMYPKVVPGLPL